MEVPQSSEEARDLSEKKEKEDYANFRDA